MGSVVRALAAFRLLRPSLAFVMSTASSTVVDREDCPTRSSLPSCDGEKQSGGSSPPAICDGTEDKPSRDPYEVVLEEADNPLNLPLARRWTAVATICAAAACVACASSAVSYVLFGLPRGY